MKGSPFQLAISAIFIFFLLAGVGAFAIFSSGGTGQAGKVVVWGAVDETLVNNWLEVLRQSDKTFSDVEYVYLPPSSYEATLVNAMASGRGPDLFLLNDTQVTFFADKILALPYSSYSQSDFTAGFVDEARLFLAAEGVRALPVFIDPLVMYWNRDLFAAAGLANPPQYWNELLTIAPNLTKTGSGQALQQSAVAMGTWRNVSYAKPLLATLIMQSGDPIVTWGETGGLRAVLGTQAGAETPAASALRFYTEFANPGKTSYSWNGSLQNSTNAFLAGDVALYFGFASDYAALRARNPNLRFDVALMPQLREGAPATYGRITGVAVSRSAANPQGAALVATQLSGASAIRALAGVSVLPPVRRDVQVDSSASAAATVFGRSALIARGWFDPGAASDAVFRDMIESVLSGKHEPASAVFEANAALRELVER